MEPKGQKGGRYFKYRPPLGAFGPSDRKSMAQIRRIAEASPRLPRQAQRARSLLPARKASRGATRRVCGSAAPACASGGAGVELLRRAAACPGAVLTAHRSPPAGTRCNCKEPRTERTWRGGTSQEPLRNAPGGHGGLPACRTPRVLFFLLPGSHQSGMDETCGSGTRLWRPAGASNSNHTILQNEQPTIK